MRPVTPFMAIPSTRSPICRPTFLMKALSKVCQTRAERQCPGESCCAATGERSSPRPDCTVISHSPYRRGRRSATFLPVRRPLRPPPHRSRETGFTPDSAVLPDFTPGSAKGLRRCLLKAGLPCSCPCRHGEGKLPRREHTLFPGAIRTVSGDSGILRSAHRQIVSGKVFPSHLRAPLLRHISVLPVLGPRLLPEVFAELSHGVRPNASDKGIPVSAREPRFPFPTARKRTTVPQSSLL